MGRPRTYEIDEAAFDKLTPEVCYWVGFLIADGNIYQDKVQLRLAAVDRSHIEKFRAFVGSTHPIYSERNHFGFVFRSKRIVARLNALGVTPRKSFTAKAHRSLVASRDFWRGVVDGNGCLSFMRGKYPRIDLVGSLALMKQYAKFVGEPVERHKMIWQVGVRRLKTAPKIARRLYKNAAVALERKALLAERMFS